MPTKLKRSVSLPILTLYGLGNILGAGIYVLVGKVAGQAGMQAPTSFLIAMLVAALTAFSYMELSSRFPVSGSVSVYLHKAFGHKGLSIGIGFAIIASGIASAAALAQGFAGYASTLLPINTALLSVGLLLALGLLAMKGIKESAVAAAVLTIVEIGGLIFVIWAGRNAISNFEISSLAPIDPAIGFSGILGGAFLAFYAFIGFEDMVNISEEVKKPRTNMPIAIVLSLISAAMLYLLVIVVAIGVVPPNELAQSSAPLALVYEKAGSQSALAIISIGMVAAINGVVVQIIMVSRILYGLGREGWISPSFSKVNARTKTPVLATLATVALMIIATVAWPLLSLAQLTSMLVLGIFCLVNTALIKIKLTHGDLRDHLKVPIIIPVLGLVSCVGLIVYHTITVFK